MLITLWVIAVEGVKADPILIDPKSIEMLEQIDYHFSKSEKGRSDRKPGF
ncbi:hypothetical protein [Microcoleus sp. Pol12B4]